MHTNDADSLHAAARAGLGLAQVPSLMFADELAAGELVPVLSAYQPRRFHIYAVSSGRRRMPGAIKVFVDFVAEVMQDERSLRIR